MTNPLISAVIATYNYGRFVTSAVESALAQTYAHREVIVVDDGSTDDTRQRLAPYMDRIRYVYQENGGISAARNTGIRAAAGPWIAFLDADDVWHPRKLELQMRCLEGQPPDVGVLATNIFTDQRQTWPNVDNASATVVKYTLEDVIGICRFGPSSSLIRKSCLEDVGMFDPALRLVEDRDLWIRLAGKCALAKLLLPLVFYRIHATSLSNKCVQMERYEYEVLDKAFSQMPALSGRWLLRRKTYGQAAFAAAQLFRTNGYPASALRRILTSFRFWPLPLQVSAGDGGWVRLRVLVNLLLRMFKLRAPEMELAAKTLSTPPSLPVSFVMETCGKHGHDCD